MLTHWREATKVPYEPKIANAKTIWIAKFVVSCDARDKSLDSASCEAKIVYDCKTNSALHRAQPCLSREAKVKALYANSEATAALHHQHDSAVLKQLLAAG